MSTTKAASAFNQHNSKSPTPFIYSQQQQHRINEDEAEAGSILVALANHNHLKQKPEVNTKSMSIHNLLEPNGPDDHRKKSTAFTERRPVSQDNGRILRESADEQYPATPPPIHYPYKHEQQHQQHADNNMIIHERMHSSPEVYNMQQQQQQQQQNNAYVTHPPHMAIGKSTTATTGHAYSHRHMNNNNQYPNFKQQQQRHPHVNAPPSQSASDFSRQYSNMKLNPKFRRNALQAYISYMTYTDITRKRMKQGPTITHNNNKKPNLPPASRCVSAPATKQEAFHYQQALASPPYPQQRRYHPSMISPTPAQHYPYQQKPSRRHQPFPSPQPPMSPPSPTKSTNLIVEQPLTAFLHRGSSQHQQQQHPASFSRRDLR